MDFEEKLAAYRQKQRREELKLRAKGVLSSMNPWQSKDEANDKVVEIDNSLEEVLSDEDATKSEETSEAELHTDENKVFTWLIRTIYFLLWLTIYLIFIKLMFGTVYLLISGLVAMYLNTRSGPKKQNEVSAYSVFNKDCKSIDGTLKAEHFEREIRYGSLAVH